MRLNQFLAACGLGSRRHCEALIAAGRVTVNGEPGHFGTRVATGDRVLLDGRLLQPQTGGGVWLLHKPPGYVCTTSDERDRPTVFELARQRGVEARVFAVGRLDLDTTGLLVLTNDGDLAYRLAHPSFGIEKEYVAQVARPVAPADLERLRTGIELEDGPTAPCQVMQAPGSAGSEVRLVLHEGRKRQVRRMLAAVGSPVLALHRVRVGPVLLGDLPTGSLRPATAAEVAALRAAVAAPRHREA
jgi:23S rRNA pseudouridine2605 synthase